MIGITHQTENLLFLPVFKICNFMKPLLHKYFPYAFCFLGCIRKAAFLTPSAVVLFFFLKTGNNLYIHMGSIYVLHLNNRKIWPFKILFQLFNIWLKWAIKVIVYRVHLSPCYISYKYSETCFDVENYSLVFVSSHCPWKKKRST